MKGLELRASFPRFSTKRFMGGVNVPEPPSRAHEPEPSLSLSSNHIFTSQETLGNIFQEKFYPFAKAFICFCSDFALEIPLLCLYFFLSYVVPKEYIRSQECECVLYTNICQEMLRDLQPNRSSEEACITDRKEMQQAEHLIGESLSH